MNLKRILLILILFAVSAYPSLEFKIINSPTGLILNNSEFFSQIQFEDNGNVRMELDVGLFNFIEIGVSFLFENLVGKSDIKVDIPQPYFAAQILNPKMNSPVYMKIGWDGKDILPKYERLSSSRRGLFMSLTKFFAQDKKEYGTLTFGLHSPFISENYLGFYCNANLYLTRVFTLYFFVDDFLVIFLKDNKPDNFKYFQGGPALKINMSRNWSLGLQFLFGTEGTYRYFFVQYSRWL